MTKDTYHHGTLKKDMISKGLDLLNKEGLEGFSLRKVASMCGVSNNAPYKHFKNKEELINAIALEVSQAFATSLLESTQKYPDNPRLQIVEMGRSYVKFMIENPEYLKFLFLTEHKYPIFVKNNKLLHPEGTPFDIFKKSCEYYLESISDNKESYYLDSLYMWSLVHGIALLIVNKVIEYDGDYLELVDKIIDKKIK
ncbi:TetR/AcrR family transcriptional regulator [Clostridium sp. WILCCON 0269]|uniref:TetR/AcrR family transcriptional regulator n=1 Tax=Candidatus Clostridium eludens TaxID=3381663 RepID=A0ABW8STR9_9CLOT